MLKRNLLIALAIIPMHSATSLASYSDVAGRFESSAVTPIAPSKKKVGTLKDPARSFMAGPSATTRTVSSKPVGGGMPSAQDPAAQQALAKGGPVGLAKYMIRKMAQALGYNESQMQQLVQQAFGEPMPTSSVRKVAAKPATRTASASSRTKARQEAIRF